MATITRVTVPKNIGGTFKLRAPAVKKKATTQVGGQALMNRLLNQYASSILTPAQQAAQAKTQSNASYAQSLAGYKEAYTQEQQELEQQAQRAQGFALASNALAPTAFNLTNDAYNQAAQNIQGLGTGLSGAVGAAQQADADKAAAQIATMKQQTGGATAPAPAGYNVSDLQNTAMLTGVTLPAADLYGQAANAAMAAYAHQAAESGAIDDLVTGYRNQQTDNTKTYTQQQLDLLAQKPAAYQSALSSAQDNQRQDLATIISGLGLENTQAGTQSGITAQDVTNAINKAKVTGTYKGQPVINTYKVGGKTYTVPSGMHIDPQTGQIVYNVPPKTPGYITGTSKLAPGYWWGPGGNKGGAPQPYDTNKFVVSPDGSKLIPIKQPPSATKTLSPAQITTAINTAAKQAQTAVLGPPFAKYIPPTLAQTVVNAKAKGTYKPLMSKAAARQALLSQFFGAYKTSAAAKAQVDRILALAGY